MYVGEEHFIEFRFAGHLFEWAHFYARSIHGAQEKGNAFVLWCVEVGACHENAPVAVAATAAPDFLTINNKGVAIEFGFG